MDWDNGMSHGEEQREAEELKKWGIPAKAASKSNRVHTYAGRFYEIDEKTKFPSVTTILQAINKPALVAWAAKEERTMVLDCSANLYEDVCKAVPMSKTAWLTTMQFRLGKEKAHRKLLAKAGELGSQTHEVIEWTLHKMLGREVGPRPKIQEKAEWAFMAWEDWAKSVSLKPLLIEQVVYSRKYGFAGTLDLLAEIKGKLTVVDWKTGKAVYEEAHLQNAAYRVAIREMGHANPVAGMMVRLPKVETDPEFEVVEAGEESAMFETFLHCKALWTWMQIGEEKYKAKRKAQSETKDSVQAPVAQAAGPTAAAASTPSPKEKPTAAAASSQKKRRSKNGLVPAAILNPPLQKNGDPLTPLPQEPKYAAQDADVPF